MCHSKKKKKKLRNKHQIRVDKFILLDIFTFKLFLCFMVYILIIFKEHFYKLLKMREIKRTKN
jgi:hypothetical protein